MINEFMQYCSRHALLDTGENIVVGVSGGADSMCLLFLLQSVRERLGLHLAVVHVNHHLRESAGRDAEYVRGICGEWKIPCRICDCDVMQYAAGNHLSTEEAGRILRYQAFERTLQELFGGHGKIAVAHNRNDRAETVLFHLFRGSGLRGLTGIGAMREHVIRPILYLDRARIESLLQEAGIRYCTDETNAEDMYARNRIRNHIIPYADQYICNRVVEHINDAADMIAEVEEYMSAQAGDIYGKVTRMCDGGLFIDAPALQTHPVILQKYVVRECMGYLTPSRKDITAAHMESVYRLLSGDVGKRIHLPYHLEAVREYDGVRIVHGECSGCRGAEEITDVDLTGLKPGDELAVPLGNQWLVSPAAKGVFREPVSGSQGDGVDTDSGPEMVFRIFDRENEWNVPEKAYTKCFDYDKIKGFLTIRGRRKGDYLTIRGDENHPIVRKRCQDYLVNEKIPRENRDRVLFLTEGEHVLWAVGLRISQYYKITDQTEKILQVQIRGGAGYGRDNSCSFDRRRGGEKNSGDRSENQ